MAAANDDKSNEIGYDFRRRLSVRIVWWSKSREEPGAHKQRQPAATITSLIKAGNRAEKFFEQGLHPALFFCVDEIPTRQIVDHIAGVNAADYRAFSAATAEIPSTSTVARC
jgi:hypothetical protein